MKILVLGNGFDIDHDLPTSYTDFLNFCNCVLEIEYPNVLERKELKESQKKYIETVMKDSGKKNLFSLLLMSNHLLTYFNTRKRKMGNNWIDFEREIKEIVSVFKSIELEVKRSEQYCYVANKEHKVHRFLKDMGLAYMDTNQWDELSLNEVRQILCKDYRNFSKALEYYVSLFINSTPVQGISPDIVDFDTNKVISFNYSDTYERTYGGVRWDETVDYVHGKALEDVTKEPNIILGITSNNGEYSSYVNFEKYFQRITKKTGNEYKKWLQARKEVDEKIEVMFFGHSLDSSDNDIIKDLIDNENSVVYIYYYNEEAHQQIVSNLVEVIGKDKLIRWVSGNNPKIQIIKQREHQKENTAGLEITRDIRKLYRMHMLREEEIDELLKKIEDKISAKDVVYFHSQRKVISLFEALKSYGLDTVCKEDALDVCELLEYDKNSKGGAKWIDEDDWMDFSSLGTPIPCNKETATLIKSINESNIKRVQNLELKKPYAEILNMKTGEEIKVVLLGIFSEKAPTKEYWKSLDEFVESVGENKLLEDAFELLYKEPLSLSIRAKVNRFVRVYEDSVEEKYYNMQFAENWDEEYD